MAKASNWTTVTESKYSWERDALDFVRTQFPPHDPYRAWCNFEFIADDGSINEVDRPMMKVVSQAMDQAGVRPSQRTRKVSDYLLQQIIEDQPASKEVIA